MEKRANPCLQVKFDLFGVFDRFLVLNNDTHADTTNFFKPQLDKRSMEMASKMGASFSRLVSSKADKTKDAQKRSESEMKKLHPFKPQINRVSQALDEHFRNTVFNGDQLYRWDQLYLMVRLFIVLLT